MSLFLIVVCLVEGKRAKEEITETAMGTQLNCQTGGSIDYVDAVVKISSLMGEFIR